MHPLCDRTIAYKAQEHMATDSLIALSSVSRGFQKAYRPQLINRLIVLFGLRVTDQNDVMQEVQRKITVDTNTALTALISWLPELRQVFQDLRRRALWCEAQPLPNLLHGDILAQRRACCELISIVRNPPAPIGKLEIPYAGTCLITSARKLSNKGLNSEALDLTLYALRRLLPRWNDPVVHAHLKFVWHSLKNSWNNMTAADQVKVFLEICPYLNRNENTSPLYHKFVQAIVCDSSLSWAHPAIPLVCASILDSNLDTSARSIRLNVLSAIVALNCCESEQMRFFGSFLKDLLISEDPERLREISVVYMQRLCELPCTCDLAEYYKLCFENLYEGASRIDFNSPNSQAAAEKLKANWSDMSTRQQAMFIRNCWGSTRDNLPYIELLKTLVSDSAITWHQKALKDACCFIIENTRFGGDLNPLLEEFRDMLYRLSVCADKDFKTICKYVSSVATTKSYADKMLIIDEYYMFFGLQRLSINAAG